MIRVLTIITVAGFIMAGICISAAIAIGGPEAVKRGDFIWDGDWNGRHFSVGPDGRGGGPETTRDFAWSGGDSLEVNAPAKIDYVQGAGPAKLTISGPQNLLNQVQVSQGQITLGGPYFRGGRLHVTLTAPDVRRFELNGAGELNIAGFHQDELSVAVSGAGAVTATGETKSVQINISGAGKADLGKLKTTGADIAISGAGQATAGPTEWAKVTISGFGDVNLLTRPPHLESHISGAGHIRQPDGSSTSVGATDDGDDDDDHQDAPPAKATAKAVQHAALRRGSGRDELQRKPVVAVAQPRGARAVIEDVALVTEALGAVIFGPPHADPEVRLLPQRA